MFFFFNDTATTEIYTLSLHDALPISHVDDIHAVLEHMTTPEQQPAIHFWRTHPDPGSLTPEAIQRQGLDVLGDRKSTRLNSSHANISYAVFCLKKKNN